MIPHITPQKPIPDENPATLSGGKAFIKPIIVFEPITVQLPTMLEQIIRIMMPGIPSKY